MFTEQADGDHCTRHLAYGTCEVCDERYFESSGNCLGKLNIRKYFGEKEREKLRKSVCERERKREKEREKKKEREREGGESKTGRVRDERE